MHMHASIPARLRFILALALLAGGNDPVTTSLVERRDIVKVCDCVTRSVGGVNEGICICEI